jgi:hypothetical protein
MKILILSRNQIKKRNWGRELFKLDIAKQHNVTFYGPGYTKGIPHKAKNINIQNIYDNSFDIAFSFVFTYASQFTGYDKIKKPKIHWEVDYVMPFKTSAGSIHVQNPFYKSVNYDLIFAPSKKMVQYMIDNKISKRIRYLPFSVCTDVYKNLNKEKIIDVMVVYSTVDYLYPDRKNIQSYINHLPYKTFTNSVTHQEYIDKINQSKIFVTKNNLYNFLNMKYTEVLACGTFLLADRPDDLNDVGLKDGQHLILYKDKNDLKDKIDYFLKHELEREEIAKNGMEYVRKYHSNYVRINEMTEIIKKEFGGF